MGEERSNPIIPEQGGLKESRQRYGLGEPGEQTPKDKVRSLRPQHYDFYKANAGRKAVSTAELYIPNSLTTKQFSVNSDHLDFAISELIRAGLLTKRQAGNRNIYDFK